MLPFLTLFLLAPEKNQPQNLAFDSQDNRKDNLEKVQEILKEAEDDTDGDTTTLQESVSENSYSESSSEFWESTASLLPAILAQSTGQTTTQAEAQNGGHVRIVPRHKDLVVIVVLISLLGEKLF